jgi:Holliday junction resolvase RusA-like endonuclease
MIHLTIDVPPMSTNRANMIVHPKGGRPMIMKTPEARAWMKRAVAQLQVQKMQKHLSTIEGPVALSMDVFRKMDSGDLGNYYKGVEDALQEAGIVRNDKQIKEHRRCRCLVDKAHPRYELILYPLEAQGVLIPLDAPADIPDIFK